MNIILANPRGFCAGVDRAIQIVEKALTYFDAVYVRHEIVHNRFVVESLKKRGVIFVEDIEQVPKGSLVIFSAHGVSENIETLAKARGLNILDATCPLVTKVHLEVVRFQKEKRHVIMIGHRGHPEVKGTLGRYNTKGGGQVYLVESVSDVEKLNIPTKQPLAYVTQTTLSVDDTKCIAQALQKKFNNLACPKAKDICYATQNRQEAVKALCSMVDVLLIVGSNNSSNSMRLKEIGSAYQVPSYLIDSVVQIDPKWLKNIKTVGISSGASAPEVLVEEVLKFLQANYLVKRVTSHVVSEENITFSLPPMPMPLA